MTMNLGEDAGKGDPHSLLVDEKLEISVENLKKLQSDLLHLP